MSVATTVHHGSQNTCSLTPLQVTIDLHGSGAWLEKISVSHAQEMYGACSLIPSRKHAHYSYFKYRNPLQKKQFLVEVHQQIQIGINLTRPTFITQNETSKTYLYFHCVSQSNPKQNLLQRFNDNTTLGLLLIVCTN